MQMQYRSRQMLYICANKCQYTLYVSIVNEYRVVQKTAQSLWHHNFATIHHRVMRFSAK